MNIKLSDRYVEKMIERRMGVVNKEPMTIELSEKDKYVEKMIARRK